jgi:hypothetical protein
MSITQTVDIPASHRLVIEVPREVPAGRVILTFTPAVEQPVDDDDDNADWFENGGECPLCAKYGHVPNAETIAAIAEGRAMMRGEKPATWHTIDELDKLLGL